MLYAILGFIAGLIVMDFAWAWKLGMPQAIWRRWKNRDSRF